MDPVVGGLILRAGTVAIDAAERAAKVVLDRVEQEAAQSPSVGHFVCALAPAIERLVTTARTCWLVTRQPNPWADPKSKPPDVAVP